MPAKRSVSATQPQPRRKGKARVASSTAPADEADDAAIAASPPPRSNRRLLLIVSAVLLVLIGATVAVLLFLGLDAVPGHKKPTDAEAPPAESVFVEAPAMVVNLRSADGAPRLIKLTVSLVPTKAEDAEMLKARLPLVIDAFQPFLRELRPEDLAGAAAVFRIKEELLLRANAAAGAGSVRDVLILDLIQQ
jgi:flagellar FliL protein